MKHSRFISLIFIILILLFSYLPAQQLALKTYTVEDGLIQSSVYSIIQDKNGYMWFGTEGGVSKFDGFRFVNFTERNGLGQNHIRSILQDSNGNLWFGTDAGGVSKYDGSKFITFSRKNGLPNNRVWTIIEDEKGAIWFGTDGGGAAKYYNGKFTILNSSNGLHSDTIRTIFQTDDHCIWFCSGVAGGGVSKYDGQKIIHYSSADGLVSDYVITIYQDKEKNIWFGTYEGLSRFRNNKFENFTSENGFIDDPVVCIYQDHKGILWLGTHLNGLAIYENNHFEFFTSENGLSSNSIKSLYQDKRGDLWIGTSEGGVSRFQAERFISYTIKEGLPAEAVYSINEDASGTIWIGTRGGGISKLIGSHFVSYSSSDGLSDDQVSSLIINSDGSKWIGTGNGLNKFINGKFQKYFQSDGMVDNWINSLFKYNDELWIATEGGISKYYEGKFTNYTRDHGLANNKVYSVYKDSEGILWAGTDNGLSRFDGTNFHTFTTKDGLSHNRVFAIHQDSKGDMWFATEEGLNRYDGNLFSHLDVNDGLSNNVVNYVIDDTHKLYVGTNHGINFIDLEKLNNNVLDFRIFTSKDGLAGSECTNRGVFKDSKGNIWFGTVKGITKYDPRYKARLVNPNVVITNIKINDKAFDIKDISEIDYSQNYIRFEFNAISFAFPEKLVYKYLLEGIDNHWSESKEPLASYPYLPPGKYTFKVIAKNGDGHWSKTPASISFIINPPFWSTWWFRIIMTIGIISLISMIFVVKTRQVKKRNIELAAMVRERTHELELEKNKSEELLHNILPATLVDELKRNGAVQPREFKNVSIMFTDFKGFTYIASVLPAEKLVYELNEMFKEFDSIIVKYNLEKLKTIGDSYMVGAGLPTESDDHAIRIIMAGLEMQEVIRKRNETSAIKWEMRTGVHSGYVIAGVVGTKKFSYDIWGDTVNIASRMESAGEPGEINISAYTYMLVRDHFECEYRGKVTAKGKGDLDMYFVKYPKQKEKDNMSYINRIQL